MATIFKRKRDRNRPGASYWIGYVDHTGRRRWARGTSEKASTQRIASKLENDADLRRRGIIDPAAEQLADHARTPLQKHLAEYQRMLESKGGTERHVRATVRIIQEAIDALEWKGVRDIAPEALAAHLAAMKSAGRAARTLNWRLTAVRGFSAWLAKSGRLAADPLRILSRQNEAKDRAFERRALTDEELARLIGAAEADGDRQRFGLSGTARAMLYRVAVGSGFRVGELKSLTPASFDLAGDYPTVTVEAAYSKRRRRDLQLIRPDLADVLASWLARMPRNERIFRLARREADMIRRDLRAARLAWRREATTFAERRSRKQSAFLAAVDHAGRVVDFHALRHTFITRLALAGVSPKVAQTLARHSTITLTMDRYAHVGLQDHAGALAALPAIETETVEQVEALSATGTDDAGRAQHWAQHSARATVRGGALKQQPSAARADGANARKTRENRGEMRPLALSCADVRQWAGSDSNRGLTDYESAALDR